MTDKDLGEIRLVLASMYTKLVRIERGTNLVWSVVGVLVGIILLLIFLLVTWARFP